MKVFRVLVFVVGITALTGFGCRCCDCPANPCDVQGQAAFFQLTDPTVLSDLRGKQEFWDADSTLPPEDAPGRCCNAWIDIVAPHCSTLIERFCEVNCRGAEDRDRCLEAEREVVREICYQHVLPGVHEVLTSCSNMAIDGVQTKWRNAQGGLDMCPPES